MLSLRDQIFKQATANKTGEQSMTGNAAIEAVADVGIKVGKTMMDVNKDGKVDIEDFKLAVKDGKSFTILLMGVISLIASAIVYLFTSGDWTMFKTIGSIIVIPFIMFVGSKKIFDTLDTEKAQLINQNLKLKDDMNEMKRIHQGEIQEFKLNQKQLEGVINLKNWEIERLNTESKRSV
jgi:hypothetical protein